MCGCLRWHWPCRSGGRAITKFPSRLQDRLAITVATTQRAVTSAHQRLNTIGSQVSALVPGDWQPVTLTASWVNLPGYVPAQIRIQQAGLALLTGHITGGTVTSGTIIGSVPAGYFNPTSQQAFTVNILTPAGAAAVLTMTVTGQLVLTNCPAAATQLSFSEQLPLA